MHDSVSRKRALTDLDLTAYERWRVLSNAHVRIAVEIDMVHVCVGGKVNFTIWLTFASFLRHRIQVIAVSRLFASPGDTSSCHVRTLWAYN